MKEISVAKMAAQKAGKILTKLFGRVGGVRKKARADYVTDADYKAEEIIIKTIHAAFPSHKILSEELHPDTTKFDDTWIVDGLDGTNNYVSKLPIYGTNIAYYHNGEPKAAAVYIPTFDSLYWASADTKGAFCNGKKIHVSTRDVLEHSAGAITTSSLRDDPIREHLTQLFRDSGRLRCTGAACYDSILVAIGVLDFRVSIPEKMVDVAAPYYIVEKAGGKATNMDGHVLTPDADGWIASNGHLHDRLIEVLNRE